MQVKDFNADKMRRLYVIRVFILCKDESLSLVRRTIASIKNAYLPDGCEVKLYLLDENRDNVKRDFFMGLKTGTDVIYITPPVRSDSAKVRAFCLATLGWTDAYCHFVAAVFSRVGM